MIPKRTCEKSIFEDPTLQDSECHRRCEESPISRPDHTRSISRSRGRESSPQRREDYYMFRGHQVCGPTRFPREIRFQDPANDPAGVKR